MIALEVEQRQPSCPRPAAAPAARVETATALECCAQRLAQDLSEDANTCGFCGEPSRLEVLEIYGAHDFVLDACCEAAHELAVEALQDPESAKALLVQMEIERLAGSRLRRVCDIAGQLRLDWHLELVPVSQRIARQFVKAHHRHCPRPPAGWRFGQGVRNGTELVGVVWVGRPVAQGIDHTTTVEVNRLCVRRDVPAEFRWNAASMLLGWAARTARKRGFEHAVTYTLETEPGTTLRAAGWQPSGTSPGGRWSRKDRPRADLGPLGPKQRWRLDLRGRSRGGPSGLTSQRARHQA